MGKEDIRKKFMDILFEPDDDDEEEIIAEGRLKNVEIKKNKKEKKEIKENKAHLTAKEILYKNEEEKESKRATVFINLNEEKKPEPTNIEEEIPSANKNNDYEFLNTISPIFGVVKENKTVVMKEEPKPKTTTIRGASPLGTIYSPIFGVGDQKIMDAHPAENKLETLESPFDDTREDTHYLVDHDDETYVVDKEISLFDDSFDEGK